MPRPGATARLTYGPAARPVLRSLCFNAVHVSLLRQLHAIKRRAGPISWRLRNGCWARGRPS